MTTVSVGPALDDFRRVARALLAHRCAPRDVAFIEPGAEQLSLDVPSCPPLDPDAPPVRAPRAFAELCELVAAHRSPKRWALLYSALWRLTHDEPHLLEHRTDPLVLELEAMKKSVQHDIHHVHAFVRFRLTNEQYIAWYEPQHRTLALAAPHFVRRFPSMRWAILTPDATAQWDLRELHLGPGVSKDTAPRSDDLEELWRAYYASVFNPARVNVELMRSHLPKRHWSTLPEASLIPQLAAAAPKRTSVLVEAPAPSASLAVVPAPAASLAEVAKAAHDCRICPWAASATQTVFGEGPANAPLMLIGEQPGDEEDTSGRPFVGPAGRLLDEALHAAGLDRKQLYVTNAVKHFKFEPRGKRRLHKRPSNIDVKNCRGLLDAELERIRPRAIVALGATAAHSFFGAGFKLAFSRGQLLETPWAEQWTATWHPSAVLRAEDTVRREKLLRELIEDLSRVGAWLRRAA